MGKFNLYNMLRQGISSMDDNDDATNEEKKEPEIKEKIPAPDVVKKPERKKYSAYRTIISRHEQMSARMDKQEKAAQAVNIQETEEEE